MGALLGSGVIDANANVNTGGGVMRGTCSTALGQSATEQPNELSARNSRKCLCARAAASPFSSGRASTRWRRAADRAEGARVPAPSQGAACNAASQGVVAAGPGSSTTAFEAPHRYEPNAEPPGPVAVQTPRREGFPRSSTLRRGASTRRSQQ